MPRRPLAKKKAAGFVKESAYPSTPPNSSRKVPGTDNVAEDRLPPPTPERLRGLSPPTTPMKPSMDPSSGGHDIDSLNPLIEQDLLCFKSLVKFYQWMDVALGLPQATFEEWKSIVKTQNWFSDTVIQDSLIDYCRAPKELQRYEPFSKLLNRIMEMGRGKLPGSSEKHSYPINDLCIIPHASKNVHKIPEHGLTGAHRRPDLVCVRRKQAEIISLGEGKAKWTDILTWFEMKRTRCLTESLSHERSQRRMLPLREDGLPVKVRKNTRTRKRTSLGRKSKTRQSALKGKQPVESPPTPSHFSADSESSDRAGMKRPSNESEHRGLYAGRGIPSSIKERDSQDSRIGLIEGWDAAVQSASYALEILSCTYGTRMHCLVFVLKDDLLYPWYYDASGVIGTEDFISLVDDFEGFAAFIITLARCSPEQFGIFSEAIMKSHSRRASCPPRNLSGRSLHISHPTTGQNVELTMKRPLFHHYILVGRRTFPHTAESYPSVVKSNKKSGPAVKCSYQANTRMPEQELVSIARTAGVKHLPKIHMWADLWKMSNGVRQIFYEKTKGKANYEDRTLRMIVYTEYCSIKQLFSRKVDLIPVMVDQLVDCLHDLRNKASILHRDISVNNIMFQIRDGKYYFILIDFDMAIVLASGHVKDGESTYVASSKFRTGTLPFMAYELIYDAAHTVSMTDWAIIKHLLRHDYQSLFWVSLYCVLAFLTNNLPKDQKILIRAELQRWETGKLASIASHKEQLVRNRLRKALFNLPPAAAHLEKWFRAWMNLLGDVHNAIDSWERRNEDRLDDGLPPEPFDEETAGGLMTRDNIKAILRPKMPLRQDDADFEPDQDDDDFPVPGTDAEHEGEAGADDITASTKMLDTIEEATATTEEIGAAQKVEGQDADIPEDGPPTAKTAFSPKRRTKTLVKARSKPKREIVAHQKVTATRKKAARPQLPAPDNDIRSRLRPRKKT